MLRYKGDITPFLFVHCSRGYSAYTYGACYLAMKRMIDMDLLYDRRLCYQLMFYIVIFSRLPAVCSVPVFT